MKRNIIEETESQKKQKLELYIRVAKTKPGFRGSRSSVPVNEFNIHECSPEGLVIPLFTRTPLGKCLKKDGYPTDTCVRYQGLLDIGVKPNYLTEDVINSIFKIVEEHSKKIRKDVIYRGIKW